MNSLATIRYSFLGIRRGRAFGLHRAAQRALFGAILPDSLLQTLSQTATRAPRRTKNQEVTVATQVTAATLPGAQPITTAAERRVIIASSVGTVFEWYDFYLYATLAPFFAALFFPRGNSTAALLSAFATYAAGFLVRPFGAIFFGRIGDLVGRKYTFLITILVMGVSTAAVGILPTYDTVGFLAPVLLVGLRLAQGLALGGEYGGAATYVAEHSPDNRRGYATSWIQTTATVGFFLSLLVIGLCRSN